MDSRTRRPPWPGDSTAVGCCNWWICVKRVGFYFSYMYPKMVDVSGSI